MLLIQILPLTITTTPYHIIKHKTSKALAYNLTNRMSILYLTDFYYKAEGRAYYKEDLFLTGQLKDQFDVIIAHPLNSVPFEEAVDLIVIRRTGPIYNYQHQFQQFKDRVNRNGIRTYNTLDGKADILGEF